MEKESLHFKIGLTGDYWDKKPAYTILVNDNIKCSGTIQEESGKVEYIEFDAEVDLEYNHLEIRLENKTNQDTVENSDKTGIVKDMLLNVESIEIDNIDVGFLKWAASEFLLDTPIEYNGKQIKSMQNCVTLGMNGSYRFKFESPFYLWLLENL